MIKLIPITNKETVNIETICFETAIIIVNRRMYYPDVNLINSYVHELFTYCNKFYSRKISKKKLKSIIKNAIKFEEDCFILDGDTTSIDITEAITQYINFIRFL